MCKKYNILLKSARSNFLAQQWIYATASKASKTPLRLSSINAYRANHWLTFALLPLPSFVQPCLQFWRVLGRQVLWAEGERQEATFELLRRGIGAQREALLTLRDNTEYAMPFDDDSWVHVLQRQSNPFALDVADETAHYHLWFAPLH